MPPSLNAAELNSALLRAFGVEPSGVTAAVLTLRPLHPPRLAVTRILVRGDAMGVVQQVERLQLQAVADGQGMAPVSAAGSAAVDPNGGQGFV